MAVTYHEYADIIYYACQFPCKFLRHYAPAGQRVDQLRMAAGQRTRPYPLGLDEYIELVSKDLRVPCVFGQGAAKKLAARLASVLVDRGDFAHVRDARKAMDHIIISMR